MQFVAHLALVSEAPSVGLSELTRVSAAVQKQVTRDASQYWDIQGTVDAFASLDDVPPGYWPIIIRDDIGQDASGLHCDDTGQPMALVQTDVDWSVTASHEALEMLIDPAGNKLIAGESVAPDQGRVEYLVEVSDPVSGKSYGVNGVKVSDFCTRSFFDPVKANGVQYSFMGSIAGPRQIIFGGYLTWFEPVHGDWWQQSWFSGDQPTIRNIGPVQKTTCGMRPTIDRLTKHHRMSVSEKVTTLDTLDDHRAARAVAASSRAKAERWRAQIDTIVSKKPKA
jgi:hypothetical protein